MSTGIDMVNSPPHYTSGDIELTDAIKASMSRVGFHSYLKGQVQRYVWRYELKENPVEDLKKAEWYLARLIKETEAFLNS